MPTLTTSSAVLSLLCLYMRRFYISPMCFVC